MRHLASEQLSGEAQACTKAFGQVLEHCPVCSACALADTGCLELPAAASTTAAPVAPVVTAHQLFDCEGGTEDQWAADKASWCCKHKKLGCPTAQTMENARLPGRACDSSCFYLGHTATCRERMVYSIAHNYGGRDEECGIAYSVMVSHCPVCASCPQEDLGCNVTVVSTTAEATTADVAAGAATAATEDETAIGATALGATAAAVTVAPASSDRFHCQLDPQHGTKGWSSTKRTWCCREEKVGCVVGEASVTDNGKDAPGKCDALCTFSGHTASCKTRVQYAITHGFAGRSGACPAAHSAVLQNCSACSECTLEEAGCSAGSGDAAAVSAAVLGAHDAHSPTPAPDGAEPYDCQANAAHWLTNWTNGKKDWCCRNLNVGCLPNVVSQETADAQPAASKLDGCEALCTFQGQAATCRARVDFATNHRFKGAQHACSDAHGMVLRQCPTCSGCALVDIGCELPS